jgi:hypothetical protein
MDSFRRKSAADQRTDAIDEQLHEIDVMSRWSFSTMPRRSQAVLTEDADIQTSLQPFVADAPVNLIVADYSRMVEAGRDRILYSAADAKSVRMYTVFGGACHGVRGLVDVRRCKLMETQPVST